MFEFNVETCIDFPTPKTKRAGELMRLFGLRIERLTQQRLQHQCRLRVRGGDIVYITGASGAGKSVLLNAMYKRRRRSRSASSIAIVWGGRWRVRHGLSLPMSLPVRWIASPPRWSRIEYENKPPKATRSLYCPPAMKIFCPTCGRTS
jgi:hypothetical protein